MTNTNVSFRGPCSLHSTLHPSTARRWGCAASARPTSGLSGRSALPPRSQPQTCSLSKRSGLRGYQPAPSRRSEIGEPHGQTEESHRHTEGWWKHTIKSHRRGQEPDRPFGHQQHQLSCPKALSSLAAIAVGAGCLHAAPALADTAVQGAEQIAQQLSSSSGAFGSLGTEPFREGLVSGFLLILFSELGDKTFFIAVLLALKKNKGIVFAGTFGALAVMTVISVVLGQALHQVDELLPSSSLPFDDIAAAVLLVFFGVRTLQAAGQADTSLEEEREAQEEVERLDSGAATGLLLSTFALVFAAEWGDKSFLATIALSAASSPVGVVTGAVAGHGVATLIAVLGGSVLGQYLNEKVVQYVGGSLFLVFAGATTFDIIKSMSS